MDCVTIQWTVQQVRESLSFRHVHTSETAPPDARPPRPRLCTAHEAVGVPLLDDPPSSLAQCLAPLG